MVRKVLYSAQKHARAPQPERAPSEQAAGAQAARRHGARQCVPGWHSPSPAAGREYWGLFLRSMLTGARACGRRAATCQMSMTMCPGRLPSRMPACTAAPSATACGAAHSGAELLRARGALPQAQQPVSLSMPLCWGPSPLLCEYQWAEAGPAIGCAAHECEQ